MRPWILSKEPRTNKYKYGSLEPSSEIYLDPPSESRQLALRLLLLLLLLTTVCGLTFLDPRHRSPRRPFPASASADRSQTSPAY